MGIDNSEFLIDKQVILQISKLICFWKPIKTSVSLWGFGLGVFRLVLLSCRFLWEGVYNMESWNFRNKPPKFAAHLQREEMTLFGITGQESGYREQIYLSTGLQDYPVVSQTILILN